MRQRILRVDPARSAIACDLLRTDAVRSAIVFCNRKTIGARARHQPEARPLKVGQIHGDMEQSERISELARFKADEINVLIASDVAARGLDIKDVSHVFNYDVPWHPDDYVHRIGRTGRAGKTGIAITLVTSADEESIDNIQKLTSMKIPELEGAAEKSEAGAAPKEEREPRPRREERPKRDRPEPREERRPRREDRAEKPRREGRADRPPRREDARESEGPDEGWNGPVPGFLGTGFGG